LNELKCRINYYQDKVYYLLSIKWVAIKQHSLIAFPKIQQ